MQGRTSPLKPHLLPEELLHYPTYTWYDMKVDPNTDSNSHKNVPNYLLFGEVIFLGETEVNKFIWILLILMINTCTVAVVRWSWLVDGGHSTRNQPNEHDIGNLQPPTFNYCNRVFNFVIWISNFAYRCVSVVRMYRLVCSIPHRAVLL